MPVSAEVRADLERGVTPPFGQEWRELVDRWPYKPYSYCPTATAAAQAAYVLASLARVQEQEGGVTYLAREEGRAQALLQLQPLAWDTEVLGFPAARITWWMAQAGSGQREPYREELLRVAVETARRQGIRYLLARLPAGDVAGVHLLEADRFQLVDALLTFGVDLGDALPPAAGTDGALRCDPARPADLPALQEIARQSFSLDRFHADPAVPRGRADEAHGRWVEDSCTGFADCVLVAREREPVGFTTLAIDKAARAALGVGIGIVVLVATAAAHRRRGVARHLTAAALEWFRQAGCAWVEVGTQLANVPAARLYQSAGFKLVGSSLTLRRLF